ncbi:hypothetical protein EV361DRAFT_931176, partial [Lentinula raphanica]
DDDESICTCTQIRTRRGQLRRLEEHEISQGPLSVLQQAARNHAQVLISLWNVKKLLACVKAFDRHCNMVRLKLRIA